MPNTVAAEVTVTKIWPPKGKYFAFNCAELVSDDNKYGRVSAPVAFFNKIKVNNVYKIAYHATEEGYLNLDSVLSDSGKMPQRPATNQKDSDRMGTMGMVNAVLHAVFAGQSITDFLATPNGAIAQVIDKCSNELHRSKMHGGEVQQRDDLNDQIGF